MSHAAEGLGVKYELMERGEKLKHKLGVIVETGRRLSDILDTIVRWAPNLRL